MKAQNKFRIVPVIALCGAMLLFSHLTFATDDDGAIQGRLVQITTTTVTMESGTFKINANTKCFSPRDVKTSCETLANIGYADIARVTLIGDVVQRIDVIDLQQ